MKKRMLSLLLALTLCLSLGTIAVSAQEDPYATMLISLEPVDPVDVYVSIADAGTLVLTNAKVTVNDMDNDSTLTIYDALVCAHDQYYEGGAAAGFAAEETQYGLSMTLLWGVDNGGSYGYMCNDDNAWSLADPISANDYVMAYTYKDTTGWSDQYSFFAAREVSVEIGEISLSLSAAGYDAKWNSVTLPVEGATITINGEATKVVTDAEGKAVLTLDTAGTYTISAVSESAVLVPPVCTVTVTTPAAPVSPVEPVDPAVVYVSIADAGELALARAKVTAHDVDNDGVLTINDALVCAHDQYYEGGADAGFGSEETQYGLSMTKLWGVDNGGAYGYYRNNISALSLKDTISTGDYIVAYTYKDTTGWSDQYSFFPFQAASTYIRELNVTLSASAYDADWNPITVPVAGATITINGEPTEFVTNENGDALLTFDAAGTYTISATSESVTLVPPVCTIIVSSFPDSCGYWAEPEIETVVAAGLMNGTGKNFDVRANMTRAQMVTTLYRMAGSPAVEGELTFTDVKENAYYADAVIWASANGIVNGTGNNKFSPNANVTRQELAVFLHRYAVLQGFDVSVGENTNILSYDDVADVKEWAIPAMQWACGAGLISGTTTSTLSPTGYATRAQVAVILARFMENVQ